MTTDVAHFIVSHIKSGYTVMFWEGEEKTDAIVVDELGYCYFQDFGMEDLLPVTIYANMEEIKLVVEEFLTERMNWEII